MALSSFAERFAAKRQEQWDVNSKQQGKMLEEVRQAEADMAEVVSQAAASNENLQSLTPARSPEPEKTQDELELEISIETHSVEILLKRLEMAGSQEEIHEIIREYNELLTLWQEKLSLLRSEEHMKEFVAVHAALQLIQHALQRGIVDGKQVAQQVQQGLKALEPTLQLQAQQRLQYNLALHKTQMPLPAITEISRRDPGVLTVNRQQATIAQLHPKPPVDVHAVRQAQDVVQLTMRQAMLRQQPAAVVQPGIQQPPPIIQQTAPQEVAKIASATATIPSTTAAIREAVLVASTQQITQSQTAQPLPSTQSMPSTVQQSVSQVVATVAHTAEKAAAPASFSVQIERGERQSTPLAEVHKLSAQQRESLAEERMAMNKSSHVQAVQEQRLLSTKAVSNTTCVCPR